MVTPATRIALPDRDRLHVSVAATIESQILSGERAPGTRLPSEAELARQFNVSTRSVREGMQILETKGLLRRRHGERAEVVRNDVGQFLRALAGTVHTLFARDADYLLQLMDVRRMFELEAVGRLAAGEGTDRAGIELALADMRASVDKRDFQLFAQADAAFHRALVQALGNGVLSTLYGNLYGIIGDVIRVASRVPRKTLADGLAEHEAIHALIRAGDVDGSRRAMREHIDNSAAYLEQAIRTARDGEAANDRL